VFHIAEKSSTFFLEIVTLVSSVNKMCADKAFIVAGLSFLYIMKSKRPKNLPLGNSVSYCSPFWL